MPAVMHALLDDVVKTLEEQGCLVFRPDPEVHPALVAIHPHAGLLALHLVESTVPVNTVDQIQIDLNRRVARLRETVPEMARTKVHRRVIDPSAPVSTLRILTPSDAVAGDWLSVLSSDVVTSELEASLAAALGTAKLVIDVPLRTPLSDQGSGARARRRIELDEAQSALACRETDALAVTGPAGSGKTLVLAARAAWLATQHPDWKIQVLCFNRVLVPYLRTLVEGHSNIIVSTFGKFVHAHGFRVSLDDELQAAADVKRQINVARSRPVLDALLIDECQDFMPCWTELASALVRPNRGGMMLAGDPNQALYRSDFSWSLIDRNVEVVRLERPYRSTKAILDVTAAMADNFAIQGRELAPAGEPVDLVWAHNAAEQAAAVARDIALLLENQERWPSEIGVLVTRKFHLGKIAGGLEERGVPFRIIWPNQADELHLSEPTVKLLTVHSAKGLEFDVVFLVGLENLPNPDGSNEKEQQGRAGYVGATRGRDQLVMTYSKDNDYLERIRSLPDTVLRRWVWPDDYPED